MLKFVLVEDEIHTANLIKNTIDWSDFGIEKCEVFYDGLSAYNYISEHGADIVMTDIKMPGMDGMTLIEKCREANCDSLFIIISGHREFQYAYKAIKYNVFDYILKPLQSETLRNILEKATSKLLKSDSLDNIPFQNNQTALGIKNKLAVLLNNIDSADTLRATSLSIPSHMLNSPCVLINLLFTNVDEFLSNQWKHSSTQFKNAVLRITSFEDDSVCFVSLNYWFDEMFLLAVSKDESKFADVSRPLEHIRRNFSEIFSLDVEYKIVSEFNNLNQLITTMQEDKETIEEDTEIIEKCKKYIYDNLHNQITLSDLAKHVFLNPIYLSAYFKEKTGDNFSAYLKNVRITRAKQLLQRSDLPISQICLDIGFKSESYFYKLFKNITGITPQQYREQKPGGNNE